MRAGLRRRERPPGHERPEPAPARSTGWRERARWLGHPGFLACAAVLLVNDHVLKGDHAGWWTGKLSDVAGVAVLGVGLAVAVGPRRGLPLTAAAFLALKAVPGVAEAAAPLLGGVTRRDPTDLVGLVVLVPLWCLLVPEPPSPGDAPGRGRGSSLRAPLARVRAALTAMAPVMGAVLAVGATTATSCAPDPAVTEVRADGDVFYALVDEGYDGATWARSDDRGRSWDASPPPPGVPQAINAVHLQDDTGPAGPLEACAGDTTCWRLRDQRAIESGSDATGWTEEVRFSDYQVERISNGCLPGHGVLGSIAAAEHRDRGAPGVVASLGADGALMRQGDGTWEQVRVLSAPPRGPSGADRLIIGAAVAAGPVLGSVLWSRRRRWPSWQLGLAVVLAGWLGSLSLGWLIGFWTGTTETFPLRIPARVMVAGVAVTAILAVAVARRSPRQRAPIPYPPSPWAAAGPWRPPPPRLPPPPPAAPDDLPPLGR